MCPFNMLICCSTEVLYTLCCNVKCNTISRYYKTENLIISVLQVYVIKCSAFLFMRRNIAYSMRVSHDLERVSVLQLEQCIFV